MLSFFLVIIIDGFNGCLFTLENSLDHAFRSHGMNDRRTGVLGELRLDFFGHVGSGKGHGKAEKNKEYGKSQCNRHSASPLGCGDGGRVSPASGIPMGWR